MTLRLRAARPTDAGSIGTILSEFIDSTIWMPRVHTRAQDLGFAGTMIERHWCTVAEKEARVVGFLSREGTTIHALYVHRDWRGQTIGRHLLNAAKTQSATLNLWTFQKNAKAQKFYLREGFHEVRRTDGAGNDEGLPDIEYCWTKEEAT